MRIKMQNEDIQKKIQSLLSLAKGNANENEAASAIAAANKLAEQYRIEIASLELAGETPVEDIEEAAESILSGGRIRSWKKLLLIAICKSQGCSCYSQRDMRSHHGTTSYYIVGRPSDIELSKKMFTWAMNELEFIGTLVSKGRGKRFANSWYNGAVDAISHGLKEGKEKARQDNCNITALTVVDNRSKEASRWATKKHNLVVKTISRRLDHNAYNQGYRSGQGMNVNGRSLLG